MDSQVVQTIVEALKEEGIDLVVTLPEEPTGALTRAIGRDPAFTSVTVASEGSGITFCAGASLGGRRCVFVTGIAGLLVGAWALSQMGPMYSVPLFILASYRGDIGDRTGIPGSSLFTFNQVGEPILSALRVPYRIADQRSRLKRMVRDAHYSSRQYDTPVVLLLTGEVLW
jgi:sulfopyruvate decarboxylase subunit alpha